MRLKPDLKITVEANGQRFHIGAVRMLDGRFHIKRGREWSKKLPYATLSEIFAESRKWANGRFSSRVSNS